MRATAPPAPAPAIRLDRREAAGAVADLGVLVPIATTLIVVNGLSATAALLPAALLYLVVAAIYRLPIPVQPLKAFGAIAIAQGLGADAIAAGALLMGVVFTALGATGLIDAAARVMPRAVIRGVQLTVGLLFLKIAWGLVTSPPQAFTDQATPPLALVALAAAVLLLALTLRRRQITLGLLAAAAIVIAVRADAWPALGPSTITLPAFSGELFWTALTLLVIPQLPLTFANSCVATADAAGRYFGEAGARVRAGRLATTLGVANLGSGLIAGMPVCHGAGGLTAHRAFGARSAGAPLIMGAGLLVLAVGFGAGLPGLLAAFPLAVLAGLLAAAGVLHLGLLRDLRGAREWLLAIAVGAIGFQVSLALAVALGLAAWWAPQLPAALRARGAAELG